MKSTISILIGIAIGTVSGASNYQGQKVLQCHIKSKQQAESLYDMDVWSFDVLSKNFTVRVKNSQEFETVEKSGAHCSVMIPDLGVSLAKEEAEFSSAFAGKEVGVVPVKDFFSDYQSYATIRDSLKEWAEANPTIATFIPSIGKTTEGRDIFAFKITGPNGGSSKKSIWFNGGLHAREWIAPTATLYTIHKLLEESKTSVQVQGLLDTFEFHFTPLANPDGYEFTRTPGNRLWRKNRSKNKGGSYGVDLNRNWDEHWGVVGSSTNPESDTYQGPSVGSEPEVKALSKYALSISNRYGGIDIHSYGQYILHNWGWSTKLSKNEKLLKPLGLAIQNAFKAKGYSYTSQTSADLYPASGALDDWMAAKAQLVSFTLELCPSPSSVGGFQLPPSNIIKCSEGAYAGILAYSQYLKDSPTIPPNPPLRR